MNPAELIIYAYSFIVLLFSIIYVIELTAKLQLSRGGTGLNYSFLYVVILRRARKLFMIIDGWLERLGFTGFYPWLIILLLIGFVVAMND